MWSILRTSFKELGRYFKIAVIVMILLCLMTIQPADSSASNEFPIGLALEYETVQQIDFMKFPLSSEKYVVTGWISMDSIVAITITDSGSEHPLHVSLPDWHATYENGSDYGYLAPLWLDISTWKNDDYVSLGSMGSYRIYDSRTIDTKAGEFDVWTARSESQVGTYSYYEHYYYDKAHGVFVEHWDSTWQDASVSEVTMELVTSNLEDYDPIYLNNIASSPLNLLLLGGILIEIFTITYLLHKRR
jgi:hypothetical protein